MTQPKIDYSRTDLQTFDGQKVRFIAKIDHPTHPFVCAYQAPHQPAGMEFSGMFNEVGAHHPQVDAHCGSSIKHKPIVKHTYAVLNKNPFTATSGVGSFTMSFEHFYRTFLNDLKRETPKLVFVQITYVDDVFDRVTQLTANQITLLAEAQSISI